MDRLYFIRVGGTAMGGVAAACKQAGDIVFGSEQDLYEPMKSYLADAGVHVYPTFDSANLLSSKPTKVVVGNAVSRGNEELEVALEHRLDCVSLPQIIGEKLIGKQTSVVVAGTHGKTTTTAMTANMLQVGGLEPGFLIGGVPGNFQVSCRTGDGNVFVIEGDEYDSAYFDKRSKFMHYRPDVAVVNNLEFDHADIFDSLEAIKKSFRLYIRLVPRNGLVLANGDDANVRDVLASSCSPVQTFGYSDGCDWQVKNFTESVLGSTYDLWFQSVHFGSFASPVNGRFNALNMVVATAVGHRMGMSLKQLQDGVQSYVSPKRRMQVVGTWKGATVIDDFGHHPTAIKETLSALFSRYSGRRIVACFEPRSNTTTRAFFQNELVECFKGVSALGLGALDRPQRYSESERLDTDRIVREVGAPGIAISLDQGSQKNWGEYLYTWLEKTVEPDDVVVLFSNGDFGGLRTLLVRNMS